ALPISIVSFWLFWNFNPENTVQSACERTGISTIIRLADDFAESSDRFRSRSQPRAVWFVSIDRLCLPLFHRDFGQHFVEVVVEADRLFGFFLPVKIRHGIFRRPAFLKRDNGGAVGRTFKRLEITQVVHLKNFEMRAIAELKTTKAVASTLGFEK